jgi:hypothetical protein
MLFESKTADDGKQRKTSGNQQLYSHTAANSFTAKHWYMTHDSILNPKQLNQLYKIKSIPMM